MRRSDYLLHRFCATTAGEDLSPRQAAELDLILDSVFAGGASCALIVLAMTLGYTSMDRALIRKHRAATNSRLCGGPTGLPKAMRSVS